MHILGIDIGGTGIKSAIVDTENGELQGDKQRIETPRPASPQAIGKTLKSVLAEHRWNGPVGIGFPSVIQHGISRSASACSSRLPWQPRCRIRPRSG